MPVAFLRPFDQGGFVPVARPRFILGSDLDCDLVDSAEGVAEHHATVRLQRGEYVLVAENGCSLWVGGERTPLMSLRDGDVVAFAQGAMPWQFRSRVEGSFWPPKIGVGEAWLSHPDYAQSSLGPDRFSKGRTLAVRTLMVLGPFSPLVVKRLGTIHDPREATHYLRFLAALGGATHPALAPVVDGGVAPHEGKPSRWLATRFVDGISAHHLLEVGPLDARRVVRILRSLAEGVAVLHHRGIVHRNIAVDNVVVPPTNRAVLIDYGSAHSLENPPAVTGPVPETGADARAPEVTAGGEAALEPPVDVYGLAAVGRALLDPSGTATENRPDRAARDVLEPLLEAATAPQPSERPDAPSLADALRDAEADL